MDICLKFNKLIVMGLIEKNKGDMVSKQITTPLHSDQLNIEELELLLILIKESSFKGEKVELVYNTTLKLQHQYINQTEIQK